MTATFTVSFCGECPFKWQVRYAIVCRHPRTPSFDHVPDSTPPPDWCPLRKEPILVQIMNAKETP